MDDITRLCRAQTRLTMLQISLLARMAIVFPLSAVRDGANRKN